MLKSFLAGLLVIAVSGAVYADYTVDFRNPDGGIVTSGTVFGNAADGDYQIQYFGGYKNPEPDTSPTHHDANTSANGLFLDGAFGGQPSYNYTVLKSLYAMDAQRFAGTTYSAVVQPKGVNPPDAMVVGFLGGGVSEFSHMPGSGNKEGLSVAFGLGDNNNDIVIMCRLQAGDPALRYYWNGNTWTTEYTSVGTFDGTSLYDVVFATDLDLNVNITIKSKASESADWAGLAAANANLVDIRNDGNYQYIIGDPWSGDWGTWSQSYVQSVSFTYVPEPATLAMLALGGLMLVRRK